VEVLQVDQHEGGETLRQASLFQKEGLEGVMIHLIKQGEDGGLVARLQNLAAVPVKGALLYEGKRYPVACDPCRLVSLRITREGTCCPADLLELD
jgi:hypothetical protein